MWKFPFRLFRVENAFCVENASCVRERERERERNGVFYRPEAPESERALLCEREREKERERGREL